MFCPKCNATLSNFRVYTTYIDRCNKCHAIWFDLNEMNEVLKIKGSEKLDLGIPEAKIVENKERRCPKCDVKLLKMSIPGQSHLEIDHCGSCHGVLLDGGELADVKDETVFEKIRTLFKIAKCV